jgi:hypothetical protein
VVILILTVIIIISSVGSAVMTIISLGLDVGASPCRVWRSGGLLGHMMMMMALSPLGPPWPGRGLRRRGGWE